MKSAKSLFRKQHKIVQQTIPQQVIAEESRVLVETLFQQQEYKQARRISVYLNMQGEIHTHSIAKDILSSGKQLFVPKCTQDKMSMVLVQDLKDLEMLPKNSWGIPEPTDERQDCFQAGGLDLIIMPGLAFDHQGNRIGYGKGYYDKFLEECEQFRKVPFTIALCLSSQYVPSVPVEQWDRKPHVIIVAQDPVIIKRNQ
ncbi:5-formyltetrahydrofolate cyclo-ligase [Gorgonomyces haynaldii]|nr:5-formyltetrahydrofolate cyclo-ligase [Gorgonomyces haynaldii]